MFLKKVAVVLNQMQSEGVISQYCIGGAIAATFYLEPIATFDVDVFVALQPAPGALLISLEPIYSWLISHGCVMQDEYILVGGWPVQFLPPVTPLVEEALLESSVIDVDGEPTRIFSAEHLAAIALETGRPKDKSRLLSFIGSGAINLPCFYKIIDSHNLAPKWKKFQEQFVEGD